VPATDDSSATWIYSLQVNHGGTLDHWLQLNEHLEGDGPTIFAHACKMGLEGIVSKRKDSAYRSGRSRHWIKSKNPKHPAVKREAGRGVGTVKKAAAILGRTLFPRAEDIPQSLAMAFMRMMMAHARFESEVRALQSTVANEPHYGEQPENLWPPKKRPKLMVKLIEEKLGQIPETEGYKRAAARRPRPDQPS